MIQSDDIFDVAMAALVDVLLAEHKFDETHEAWQRVTAHVHETFAGAREPWNLMAQALVNIALMLATDKARLLHGRIDVTLDEVREALADLAAAQPLNDADD